MTGDRTFFCHKSHRSKFIDIGSSQKSYLTNKLFMNSNETSNAEKKKLSCIMY